MVKRFKNNLKEMLLELMRTEDTTQPKLRNSSFVCVDDFEDVDFSIFNRTKKTKRNIKKKFSMLDVHIFHTNSEKMTFRMKLVITLIEVLALCQQYHFLQASFVFISRIPSSISSCSVFLVACG